LADSNRQRLSPNLAAALVLIAVAAVVLLWQRPWQGEGTEPQVVSFPDDAAAVLTAQARTMTSATSAEQLADAFGRGDQARALGRTIWAAGRLLGVDDVTWRYVSGGDVATEDDGDGRAIFDLGWGSGSVKVTLRVEPRDDAFDVVAVTTADDAELPIWLAGRLSSREAGGVEVIRVDDGDRAADVEAMAKAALAAVDDVVGSVDGPLVVVSPPSTQVAARLLGTPEANLASIAAVSTSRDGRDGRLPDRVVVLNPEVFAGMDRRAAQIVMTHEATHVLVGGALASGAESWVVEGFADFVALHDDTADLSISAGQILRQVRDDGAPATLPSAQDFGSADHGLGAVYESAWLVFRMLGEKHGDAAVVDFYRAVIEGATVDDALRARLGESVASVTAQWRSYLTTLASDVR